MLLFCTAGTAGEICGAIITYLVLSMHFVLFQHLRIFKWWQFVWLLNCTKIALTKWTFNDISYGNTLLSLMIMEWINDRCCFLSIWHFFGYFLLNILPERMGILFFKFKRILITKGNYIMSLGYRIAMLSVT